MWKVAPVTHLRLSLVVVAAVWFSAGCSPAVPSTAPARATAAVGHYRLDLTLDKSVWRAGDLITGTGTLTNTGSAPAVAYGSGMGILSFEFEEVGGSRRLFDVVTADCAPHDLSAGASWSARVAASGGYTADASDAWIAAANDPEGAKLPAGAWDVTVRARFAEDDCGGASFNLGATVRVSVLG